MRRDQTNHILLANPGYVVVLSCPCWPFTADITIGLAEVEWLYRLPDLNRFPAHSCDGMLTAQPYPEQRNIVDEGHW